MAYTPSLEEAHLFGQLLGLPYLFANQRLAYVVVQAAQQRIAQVIAMIANAEGCSTAVFDTLEAAQRWLLVPER